MKANSILPIRLSFSLLLLTLASYSFAFELNCPADVTVDCNTNIYDLSVYGNAQYKDYSGWHDAGYPTVEYDFNHCDQGEIIRTWTVLNPYANVYVSCSQIITVGDASSFSEANITWPQTGLEVTGCNPDLSPEALPPAYQQPTWTEGPCSLIGVSYSDKTFSLSGACKKVIREWELINCCDFNIYTGHGIFKFFQEIDVIATDLPELTCPTDITVQTHECDGAFVDVDLIEIMESECNDIVQISNNSPFADSNDENASGFYPIGTTEVTFLANFGCSDLPEVCKINITVVDETTPTPYCLYGLSIALMGIDTDNDGTNDEGMVEVWASDLDAGSYASCDGDDQLSFSFSSDISDNVRTFTCEDVGRNDIEIWVTDEDGNQNFCNTYVRVQNNAAQIEDCEDSDDYSSLSGHLSLHYGGHPGEVTLKAVGTSHVGEEIPVMNFEVIETVTDSFQNNSGTWIYILDIDSVWIETTEMIYPTQTTELTNFGGEYTFLDLPHYHDYTIEVDSEDSNEDRVNKGDLLELKAYLEGFIEFTIFQKMAADINQDGEVTIEDYNLLDAHLDGSQGTELDATWHFYDQAMDMEHLEDNEECEEFCTINDLKEDTYKVNLVGFRLGDITDIEVESVNLDVESISPEITEEVSIKTTHSITPNPFVSDVNVSLKNAEMGEALFVLKDQSGHIVMTRPFTIKNTHSTLNINVAKPISKGLYIYEIRTKSEVLIGKLLKI